MRVFQNPHLEIFKTRMRIFQNPHLEILKPACGYFKTRIKHFQNTHFKNTHLAISKAAFLKHAVRPQKVRAGYEKFRMRVSQNPNAGFKKPKYGF